MIDLGLGEAAAMFAEMAIKAHEAAEHALERAARVVEKEAKDRIGSYQGDAGPFGAWPQLAESTQSQRVALGFSPNDPGLRTGEMRDSIEHKVHTSIGGGGLDGQAHIGSDDQNLVWFELGTTRQPARSVLGSAAFAKSQEVRDILGDAVSAVIAGERAI